MLKKFKDLTEREILAIAIANEEEDGRIYGEFADALRESYPATADMFEEMQVRKRQAIATGSCCCSAPVSGSKYPRFVVKTSGDF